MALVNDHFLKLPSNYLFADIAKKVNAFKATHPKADVISLGIGDVTQPLAPAVIEAIHKAADEMATQQGFRGYGPEQGYDFLRDAILKHDFLARNIRLERDEIFVNDGDAVFTSRCFPSQEEHYFRTEGDTFNRLWPLKPSVSDTFLV